MADNLIFPIGFDLEKGVADAQKQMDSTLRRLQKTVDGKPLTIPMSLDASKFTTFESALRGSIQHITDDAKNLKATLDNSLQTDNSSNINRITEAMRSLEAAWKALPNNQKFDIDDRLTPKAQEMVRKFNELATASSTYGQTLSQIAGKVKRAADEEAKANQKRNDSYAKLRKTLGAQENSIANLSAKIKAYQQILNSKEIGSKSFERVAVKIRKLTEQLDKAKAKVAELTGGFSAGANKANNALNEHSFSLSNLIKRAAAYWSIHQVVSFLNNVKNVTAEFELQRISLGAIIQDQTRATRLFSEIKYFALTSPVKILDLTKYTKQLAAYKIETEELFETTKKLTDISVGLGVSMDRIVLLYGQIRATGYLRASEVRQATEAGIPLVEELAKKLYDLNGELVSSAEVMDMISKRAISFDMVKEVFDDMTEKGGMFYNMQVKQGDTLAGMWAKLGDAASVMYDEIGNTESVNSGMKTLIGILTDMMRNWQRSIAILGSLSAAIAINTLSHKMNAAAIKYANAAQLSKIRGMKMSIKLTKEEIVAKNLSTHSTRIGAAADLAWTSAKLALTSATIALRGAFRALWATILSNPIGIIIGAIGMVISYFLTATDAAEKLSSKLDDISSKYKQKTSEDVQNLKRLIKSSLDAADGSTKQKEALEELRRTYEGIIPVESLKIESLRAMKGEYGELVDMIELYNKKQETEEKKAAVKEITGESLRKLREKVREAAEDFGMSEDAIVRMLDELHERVEESSNVDIPYSSKDLVEAQKEYVDLLKTQKDMLDELDKSYAKAEESVNKYENRLNSAGEILNYSGDSLREFKGIVESIATDGDGIWSSLKSLMGAPALDEVFKLKDFVDTEEHPDYDNYLAIENIKIVTLISLLKKAMRDAGVEVKDEYFNIIQDVSGDAPELSSIFWNKIFSAIPENNAMLRRNAANIQKIYEKSVPSDATVNSLKNKMIQIATNTGVGMNKMNQYVYDGSKKLKEHVDDIGKTLEELNDKIYKMEKVNSEIGMGRLFGFGYDENKIKEEKKKAKAIKEYLTEAKRLIPEDKKDNKGGRQSDQRLQTLKEIANKMAEVNKEYDQLLKKEGQTKALADTQKLFASSFKQMQATAKKYGFKLPAFEVPQTIEDVQKWYKAIMDNIKRLNIKNADKVLIELGFKSDKAGIDKQQKDIEAELKRLADRISRTKTAKEFYEKILGMTGDVELAANVSLQIYGSTGRDLKEQIKEQFTKAFEGLKTDHADIMPDVTDIINRGAYEELRDYIALLPEAQRKAAEDLVKAQQQMSVKQYEQWLKDLEKAKDYADKRIELSRYTANQIAAIEERIAKLNPQAADYEQQKAMLEKLIAEYKSRESKMGSELEYEQFKNSALYVQVFENLNNASKTALENMRNRLLALKDQWKNLSPEKVKELTKRLEELDAQIAQRNPFKSIADSIKKLREMRMGGRTKEGDAQISFDAEADRQAAEAKMLADEKAYEAAVKQYGAESNIAKEKRKIADDSAETYRRAEQAADRAAENADEWEKVAEAINAANQKLDIYQQQINEALGGVRKIMESFGASAEDMQFFDDVTNGFNEIFDAGQQGAAAYADFMQGNFVGAATKGISAVGSLISGVTNLFYAGRVKRANKEIKRQQELLEQLQYRFEKVSAAADKLFGKDYINNYNEQMRILEAQAAAYQKQLDAEKSKGKKADKAKQKEYEEDIRDVKNQMEDLRSQVAEKALGTDLSSAAKDFATSWLEARASFGNTVNAIKEKFKEMIKSFMIEMAASKIMETLLSPLFKDMTSMIEKGDIEGGIDKLVKGMDTIATKADGALELFYQKMLSKGYDMQNIFAGGDEDGVKGYSRNIATASEESIYGLTQATNTQNHYISYIPRIAEEVTAIRILSEKRDSDKGGGMTDIILLQNQAMSHLTAISQHTSETVNECRRIALACEEEVAQLKRVIAPRGSRAPYSVQVNMN